MRESPLDSVEVLSRNVLLIVYGPMVDSFKPLMDTLVRHGISMISQTADNNSTS